jgi:transposase-like protein
MKEFKNLQELIESFKTEKQAIDFFIQLRWNGKVKCPFKECKANEFEIENNKIYKFQDGKRFKCSCCKKIFSFKTGTIFENTKLTMKKWFLAIYLQTANKKGISSCQLAKHLGIHQSNAWFVLQRIRFLQGNSKDFFDGTTEIDEVYLGGSDSNRHTKDKGKKEKMPVLGMVNRESGKAKAMSVESSKYQELGDKVLKNVKEGSTIITDEFAGYTTLRTFYNHETINHSQGEYVKYEKRNRQAYKITTNGVEGMFSHIRRMINGTFHWISLKHLDFYMNEFTFRWNSRKSTDRERFLHFFNNVNSRLTYKTLIA